MRLPRSAAVRSSRSGVLDATTRIAAAAVALASLAACGARSGLFYPADGARGDARADRPRRDRLLLDDLPPLQLPDLKLPATAAAIYAHTSSELYKLDPDTLALAKIGNFGWPSGSGSDSMTDLAVSRAGVMIGISFTKVYAVNPQTAACTALAPLPESFNALSFAPIAAGGELLLAGAGSGKLYTLNPLTGGAKLVGAYGGGYQSSGDIVSVKGFGTVATVTAPGGGPDWLVKIDPSTGVASPIGAVGHTSIWGLGYWKNKLYGFTATGKVLAIDVASGAATVLHSTSAAWWGAGVTTNAPTN
jgi:predicted small lipoprotein YifL